MITAKNKTNILLISVETNKDQKPFFCPECSQGEYNIHSRLLKTYKSINNRTKQYDKLLSK